MHDKLSFQVYEAL